MRGFLTFSAPTGQVSIRTDAVIAVIELQPDAFKNPQALIYLGAFAVTVSALASEVLMKLAAEALA